MGTGVDFLLLVKSYGDLSVFNPPPPLCFAFIPILTYSSLLGSLYLLIFRVFYFGRVARRPPTSTVDAGVLSRLLTPTQASLARSKSAATLSADGKDAPGNLGVEEPDGEEG